MYHEGEEWDGAASATEVSTEYFGPAQQQKNAEPSPLLTALPFPSNRASVSTWYGREGYHDINLPIPIYARIWYGLDVTGSRMDWQCVVESAPVYWSTCGVALYVIWKSEMVLGAASATVGSTEYFQKHKEEYHTCTVEREVSMLLTSPTANISTWKYALVSTWYGREGQHETILPAHTNI